MLSEQQMTGLIWGDSKAPTKHKYNHRVGRETGYRAIPATGQDKELCYRGANELNAMLQSMFCKARKRNILFNKKRKK